MQVVSKSYQNYRNRAVIDQVKDIGRETVLEMTVNLLMRDIGGKCTEAKCLDEIQTKVLFYIQSHLLQLCIEISISSNSRKSLTISIDKLIENHTSFPRV